jgi:uncharacterized membrane protein
MAKEFFSDTEQSQIIEAIRLAENRTNGEIRVHLEAHCKKDPYERAREVFYQLHMHKTEARNGVLIYIAYDDHKLAILGDEGIHQKVGQDFWHAEKDVLVEHFRKNEYAAGLCKAIADAGEKLRTFFPKTNDNTNELSNDISFGGGSNG